jgi:hypothetical protein
MDEFLKLLGSTHIYNDKAFNDVKAMYIDNIENGLRDIASAKICDEFMDDIFTDNINEIVETSFAEGMKVAIAIMNKEYKPYL